MPKVKMRDGSVKEIGKPDKRTGKYSEEDRVLAEILARDFNGEVILDSDKSGQVTYWDPKKKSRGMGKARSGGSFRD